MKVIDLLVELNNLNIGKVAALPKKIKMYGDIYELKKDGLDNHYYYDGNLYSLVKDLDDTCDLNHEIEIIEDNKIESLNIYQEKNCKNNWKWKCNGYNISTPQKIIGAKLNEVIIKLNKMEDNK